MRNLLQAKSTARVSSSICEYLVSVSDSDRLAYWTTCHGPSFSLFCTNVADIPSEHPSTWTSCSALGSKYVKVVSSHNHFFRSSNASRCSFSHLNFDSFNKLLNFSVDDANFFMNLALYCTVHRNELSSFALRGGSVALIAWTLLGSGLTPSLENISPKYRHLSLRDSHFDLLNETLFPRAVSKNASNLWSCSC